MEPNNNSCSPQLSQLRKQTNHFGLNNKIDYFTVVCSVAWPLDGSEPGVDVVLIQSSLLLLCKCAQLAQGQQKKWGLYQNKVTSTPALLPSKGYVTEQTTVKWSIIFRRLHKYSWSATKYHIDFSCHSNILLILTFWEMVQTLPARGDSWDDFMYLWRSS